MTEKTPSSSPENINRALALECVEYFENGIQALHQLKNKIDTFFNKNSEFLNTSTLIKAMDLDRDIKLAKYPEIDEIYHNKTFNSIMKDLWKYESITAFTPWKEEGSIAHNVGISQYQSFKSLLAYFVYTQESFSNNQINNAVKYFKNIDALLDQTIAHFQSIISIIQEKIGTKEYTLESCKAINAIVTSLKARILFDGSFQLSNDRTIPNKAIIQVQVYAQDPDIKVPVAFYDLVENLYNPNSNASRIVTQEFNKEANPEDLVIENNLFEIEHNGKKYVAIEVFNSGRLLDITAIQKKMTKLDEDQIKKMHSKVQKIVQAIKQGSRQASLNQIDPTATLFLDGFTMGTGGTGIGLNTMYEHIEMKNGAIMIDNVYGSIPKENGVCVTILFPQENQGDKGINTSLIKKNLHKLKELMQTGKYFLPREELKKVAV